VGGSRCFAVTLPRVCGKEEMIVHVNGKPSTNIHPIPKKCGDCLTETERERFDHEAVWLWRPGS